MSSQRSAAVIDIKEGRELKNTQFIGKQSPYVIICTTSNPSHEVRTPSTYHGGETGRWNELKFLEIYDQNDSLVITVMNENKNAVIGRLRLPCGEICEQKIEKWHDIYDSSGGVAGKLLLGLFRTSYEEAQRITAQPLPSPPRSIGGFTQPASSSSGYSQPATIGGFTQPTAIIGGFSQPKSSPGGTIIGGFQQPSAVAPNNAFGGFTVVGSTAGGYQQTQCHISGASTNPNLPANSAGHLSPSLQQPNVTYRGEYIPQTDTVNGGRALYSAPPAPIAVAPATYASPPIAEAYSQLPQQSFPQQQQQQYYQPAPQQYQQPLYPSYTQSQSPSLPPGWEIRYTAEGKPYYLNHLDKTTSWTLPSTY
jgi:hypothetical protein